MATSSHIETTLRNKLQRHLDTIVREMVGLIERVQEEPQPQVDMHTIEKTLHQHCQALEATALSEAISAFDLDAPRVEYQGVEYEREATPSRETYYTTSGPVEIERFRYIRPDAMPRESICPMELRAGLALGQWTPGAADAIAAMDGEIPPRRAHKLAHALGILPYGLSSFQRLGDFIATLVQDASEDQSRAVRQVLPVPEETAAVSVAIDRVRLVIDSAEHGPLPPRDRRKDKRQLEGKMAFVAALTLHDKESNVLQTIRSGCLPQGGDEVKAWREALRAEVARVLEARPDVKKIALSDGEGTLHQILEEDLEGWSRLIDYWHVIEKIAAGLKRLLGESSTEALLGVWKLQLLNKDNFIEEIEKWFLQHRPDGPEVGSDDPVDAALRYIQNHKEQMNYAPMRRAGLPVGSGSVESTCKMLVILRMRRNGQRWSRVGAQKVLTLRSLWLSERWSAAMPLLLRDLRQPVIPIPRLAA